MLLLSQTPNFALAQKLGLNMVAMTAHVRGTLADQIKDTADDQAAQLMRQAILDHGGTLIEPASGWGPLEYQVQLFGASGTGASLADAARQWAKAVRRMNHSTSVAA